MNKGCNPLTDRNYSLDFLKGIGCIGVVFIHILFPGMFGRIVMKIAQFAVPVFFLTSGYYLYNQGEQTLLRRLKRIIGILFISFMLYLLVTVVLDMLILNSSLLERIRSLPISLVKLILIGNFDFVGVGHLYFLYIQIISYVVLLRAIKHHKTTGLFKMIPVLFLLRIVVYCITHTFGLSWHIRSIFVWDALPWMLLGLFIASYYEDMQKRLKFSFLLLVSFLGASFALLFEVLWIPIDLSEIGIIIFSTGLFLLVVLYPRIHKSNIIVSLGTTYSLYVYVIHLAVGHCYAAAFYIFHIEQTLLLSWIKPIVVLMLSVAFSVILYKTRKLLIKENNLHD